MTRSSSPALAPAARTLPETCVTSPNSASANTFDDTDAGYVVKERIRRVVEFRQHDLLKDAYPQGIHLALCRNVMIYFTDDAKKNISRNIFHSLRDNGVLFIGATEALFNARDVGFERVSNTFYRKLSAGEAVA